MFKRSSVAWLVLVVAWAYAVPLTLEGVVLHDPRSVITRVLMTLGTMAIGGLVWLMSQPQCRDLLREQLLFRNQGHRVLIAILWALLVGLSY